MSRDKKAPKGFEKPFGAWDFMNSLYHEFPNQPDLQQVESIVYDDHAPGRIRASGEVILPRQVHPAAHQIGAVLDVVKRKKHQERKPAPTRKKNHAAGPDQAVNQARQGLCFFIFGHPVGLE